MKCLICKDEIAYTPRWSELLRGEKKVCERCSGEFVSIGEPTCRHCGRPYLEEWFVSVEECKDCLKWKEQPEYFQALERNESIYVYNEFAKEWVALWKYRGDFVLIDGFREALAVWRKKYRAFDYIVPVPLSEERLRERGFNQAEAVARLINTRKVVQVLKRVHSEKQSKQNREERLHRESPFSIEEHVEIKGKSVLLVDDIYTTGKTLHECALLLKNGGADRVAAVTIFR